MRVDEKQLVAVRGPPGAPGGTAEALMSRLNFFTSAATSTMHEKTSSHIVKGAECRPGHWTSASIWLKQQGYSGEYEVGGNT